ncbi:MAG TPA: sigma-70 family RNA polymerase sigma factor [Myxococcales bacterium]|nr:sigma-70 family RNA polymerase sigma factor [Myxococcales bacterium]
MDEPVQADLISRARAGDRRALRELIVAWQAPVARFVLAQVGDRGEVEDLCQLVFVKMVRGLPRLKLEEAFEGWLFQIARNACRDWMRRRRWQRRLFVALGEEHEGIAASDARGTGDGAPALALALQEMPAPQRELIALSLDGRHSYEEMARLQAVSVPAFKSRLFRAREQLKRVLAGKRGDRDER